MKTKRVRQVGFTLIELLVVVAIIAVLVAILLPALTRARELGKQAACGANLRQIGLGFEMYINDNAGWIPGVNGIVPIKNGLLWKFWFGMVTPYLQNLKIFECPTSLAEFSFRKVSANPYTPGTQEYYVTMEHMGYGYNYGAPGAQWPDQRITQISRPAQTLILCDSYGQLIEPVGQKSAAVGPMNILRSISGRHNEQTNVLFFDWHIKSYSKDYLDNQVVTQGIWLRD